MTSRRLRSCVALSALLWAVPVAMAGDDEPAPTTTTEWGSLHHGLRLRVTAPGRIEQGAPLTVRIEMRCVKEDVSPGVVHVNTRLPDAFLRLELVPVGARLQPWPEPIVIRPHDPTYGMPFSFADAPGARTPLDGSALPSLEVSFPLATASLSLPPRLYRAVVVFEYPGPAEQWPAPVAERADPTAWRGRASSGSFRVLIQKEPERTATHRLPTRLRLLPGLRVGYSSEDAADVELRSRNGHFLTTEYSRNGEMFALMSGAPEPDDVNAIDAWPGHTGALDVTYGIRILATADPPGHLWFPGQGGTTWVLWTREMVLRADAAEVAELGGATKVETHPADAPLPEHAVLRLGTTRLRHPGHVSSVACSPDGRLVASCSDHPARVRVWESTTGRLVHDLGDRGMSHSRVVFAPDGALLATGSFDGVARLWSASTGALVREIRLLPPWPDDVVMGGSSSPQAVRAVAFSPDGRLLAFGGRCHESRFGSDGGVDTSVEARLAVVEVATGTVVRRIDAVAPGGVSDAAFSPDGTLLATADGAAVRLWEMETGAIRRTLDTGDREPERVLFARDGTWLLIGSDPGLRVYDVATGAEIADLGSQGGQLPGLTLAGDRVAASGWQTIRLWDSASWKLVRGFDASWHQMRAIAASRDGSVIGSGCGNSVRIWDTEWFNETVSFDAHRAPVEHVVFSPDGAAIATGGADGEVRLWDASHGTRRADLAGHDRGVTSLDFRADGGVLASAGNSQSVRLQPLDGSEPLPAVRAKLGGTEEVAYSPDGRTLAIGGRDGTVILWDVAAGSALQRRERMAGGGGMVTALVFNPAGTRLAAAHSNGAVHVLDGATAEVRVNVTVDAHWATDLAWSPEGNRIVGAFHDGSVRIFEAGDGTELRVLTTDVRPATGAAWSLASPSRIATTSEDGSVRLWDPKSGVELARFDGHDGPVLAVAFSPDGRRLVTGGADTTALVWRVPTR